MSFLGWQFAESKASMATDSQYPAGTSPGNSREIYRFGALGRAYLVHSSTLGGYVNRDFDASGASKAKLALGSQTTDYIGHQWRFEPSERTVRRDFRIRSDVGSSMTAAVSVVARLQCVVNWGCRWCVRCHASNYRIRFSPKFDFAAGFCADETIRIRCTDLKASAANVGLNIDDFVMMELDQPLGNGLFLIERAALSEDAGAINQSATCAINKTANKMQFSLLYVRSKFSANV